MIDFGCVSSRILWIRFKLLKDKGCVVVGYGPNEGIGEERDRFWNDMDRSMARVGNEYRLCVLEDLNGWIGDRVRAGITCAFGIPGENENGRRVVEFCAERGMFVNNTYFEHNNLHKYTRVAKSQDRVEVKSMIGLVLVKKIILRFVQDVRAVRGMRQGISDHHVVLCKVRLVGTWIKKREVVD